MEAKDEICRLCLDACTSSFTSVEESIRDILDALLPQVDLSVSEQPTVCESCVNSLITAFDFKSTCKTVQKYIISFASEKTKADLKEIFLTKMNDKGVCTNLEDHTVCRFCMELVEENCFFRLENQETDITVIKLMLDKYLPEMDLNITDAPVICISCYELLQTHFNFLMSCLNIEENINRYCKVEGTDGGGQIKLNKVLEFMLKNVLEYKQPCDVANTTKEERIDTEIKPEMDDVSETDILGLGAKEEVIDAKFESCDFNSFQSITVEAHEEIGHGQVDTASNNVCNPQQQPQHPLETSNTNTTTARKLLDKSYRCHLCVYKAKYKCHLNTHMETHNIRRGRIVYSCSLCAYGTGNKTLLSQHIQTHKKPTLKTVYKCKMCGFKTQLESDMQSHVQTYHRPQNVVIYTCVFCRYETGSVNRLCKHLQIHVKLTKFVPGRCKICGIKTSPKLLKYHLLTHKKSSNVKEESKVEEALAGQENV